MSEDIDGSFNYNSLSLEAKESVKCMVDFCINHGYCLGKDEGIDAEDNKHPFLLELEGFVVSKD